MLLLFATSYTIAIMQPIESFTMSDSDRFWSHIYSQKPVATFQSQKYTIYIPFIYHLLKLTFTNPKIFKKCSVTNISSKNGFETIPVTTDFSLFFSKSIFQILKMDKNKCPKWRIGKIVLEKVRFIN